jgi:sugar phosphate isomerase/epimerase
MRFGASVWPFQWEPPYDDALRRIARLGLRAVELIAWDRDALDSYYTLGRIDALRSLLDGEGLILSEFVSTPPGLSSPDPARRAAAVEHFRRAADVAVALGTETINTVAPYPLDLDFPRLITRPLAQVWTAEVPPGLDWVANWADYVETTRQLCAICEERGLRYALESHPYRWVCGAVSMLRLIDHVGSPALGMNLDPSHMFPMGEMPHVSVYQLGGRVWHAHVSDNDGTTNAHWRPGKGKVDWRALLIALHHTGFDGTISIELEDVPGVGRAGRTATEEFDHENRLSLDYLSGLCAELGIPVEAR